MRLIVCAAIAALPLGAATCEGLANAKLANTRITAAQSVAAGALPGPPIQIGPLPADFKSLPAFCRVQGVIEPAADSHIEFEVWLPVAGWNGKYRGLGNGGFAGAIDYGALATCPCPCPISLLSSRRAREERERRARARLRTETNPAQLLPDATSWRQDGLG